MSDLHVKYLLIGGGVAAYSAAAAIRARDAQAELVLVGQEINRPYYRTTLSKGFLTRLRARTTLFTCEPDWFSQQHVQLRTGRRAAHLDPGRAIVTLESGEAISYDRLLLATGSAPRPLGIPGDNLPNIFTPRTIEDYEQLHKAIDKARAEGRKHASGGGRGRAVVIGGGLLGVEIAASLTQSGIGVDLVVSGPYPWFKFAGESAGRWLSHVLASRGVNVLEGVRATRIEGDGRAQRAVLSNGDSMPCDFVVSAVGSVPNKDLLRGTGIIAEKAILADEHCRTNVPDIFAAGDCAAVRDPIFGKHRPAEQWDTAASTGEIAGRNMSGEDIALSAVTSFSTEVFDLPARAWGNSRHVQRRLLRGAPAAEKGDFLEIGVWADGRVSQILAVGRAADDKSIEELIRRRVSVVGHEEALKDPAYPLEKLLD